MQARRRFARREEAGDRGRAGLRVGFDAAHGVVDGRVDLHRLLRDIYIAQGVELLVHGRQLALDERFAPVGHIQVDPAVLAAATGQYLFVDRAGDDITRKQLRRAAIVDLIVEPAGTFFVGLGKLALVVLRHILRVEHEPVAVFVLEDAALAADPLGDQQAADSRWPDHSGRMELDHFEVHQLRAGVIGHHQAVAGGLPGVRGDFVHPAPAAGRQDHGFGFEDHKPTGFARVAEGPADPVAVFEQLGQRNLHVDIHAV